MAIIIDCRGEEDKDGKRTLSSEATALKEAFEGLKFCVLCFTGLVSESIATLLQSFQNFVDHSELSMFALVFLSEGNTLQVYDINKTILPFSDVFRFFSCPTNDDASSLSKVPKLFIFNLMCSNISGELNLTDIRKPPNSVILVSAHVSHVSPTAVSLSESLNHECIQQCFDDICTQGNKLDQVKCVWYNNTDNKFYISKSINTKYVKLILDILYMLYFL